MYKRSYLLLTFIGNHIIMTKGYKIDEAKSGGTSDEKEL
jgi:hypothetical protein